MRGMVVGEGGRSSGVLLYMGIKCGSSRVIPCEQFFKF